MNTRKTLRKNKTKQIITWPSADTYFTIDTLVESNQHMLTTSGSDITLRVRLNKAITEENLVSVIGHRSSRKGRPQLVFALRPVKQEALDKAAADNIMLNTPKTVNVIEVTTPKIQTNVTQVTSPVENAEKATV